MSFHKEIWDNFSNMEIKGLIEKNNNAEYITWSKIWKILMDTYPETSYSFEDRNVAYPGSEQSITVEVSCKLTIKDGDSEASHTMHLPVMEKYGQFLAIENPSARQISDARMRCLVKAAAMFGLGLSMWAGEDTKVDFGTQKGLTLIGRKAAYRWDLWRTAGVIKQAFLDDDSTAAVEAWDEVTREEQEDLWIAETKGGFFTQEEKRWIQKLKAPNSEEES